MQTNYTISLRQMINEDDSNKKRKKTECGIIAEIMRMIGCELKFLKYNLLVSVVKLLVHNNSTHSLFTFSFGLDYLELNSFSINVLQLM